MPDSSRADTLNMLTLRRPLHIEPPGWWSFQNRTPMAPGWNIDADELHGWLCLRVARTGSEAMDTQLADAVTALAAARNCYRIVLEFADGLILSSLIAGQLVVLHKRIHLHAGTLRLCALSPYNYDVLRLMGLNGRFQYFPDRTAAVSG